MTQTPAPRTPSRQPTAIPELNTVLAALVERVAAALGDNFVGAYLHGSLAIGDFDAQSDVDVAIVVAEDVAEADLPALQALHAELFETLPAPWGQKLELSYFPAAILKRWSESPRDPPGGEPRLADWIDPGTGGKPRAYPLLYLDNGARQLVRSEHDNSRVVRWTLRERGIVLAGPDPRELIDLVTPIALRAEVRGQMQALAARCLANPGMMSQRWRQAFFVTLFCRMLHTLTTGEVGSKQAATAWAVEAFALRWNALIRRALAMRAEPLETRLAPADRADIQETQAFIRQVLRQDTPKKPKPRRRGPKPGFTFNALAPGQPASEAPAKRAPPRRSKGPPSKAGPYSKDPGSKRPPRDGAEKRPYARDGATKAPYARDASPRDGAAKRPYARDGAAKPAYARDATPREGAEKRTYSRDAAPRDAASRGPSKSPYPKGPASSRGPTSKGPYKGPPSRGGPPKRPSGGRPPPKR